MSVVLFSALIGPADDLFVPVPYPGVRYVCVTDREPEGWERLPSDDPSRPRLSARRAKGAVHDLFPDAEYTIWLDASFDLLVDPRTLLDDALKTGRDVVGFRHPVRTRIKDEGAAILAHGFARKDVVERQLETYRRQGFDTDAYPQRVLTNGCLIIRRNTPQVKAFSLRWLREIEEHTPREQLSVDYAAWVTNTKIGYLNGHYLENRYVRYKYDQHQRGRVLDDMPI